nr:hypothetical protein [Fodinicola feengrottensis]
MCDDDAGHVWIRQRLVDVPLERTQLGLAPREARDRRDIADRHVQAVRERGVGKQLRAASGGVPAVGAGPARDGATGGQQADSGHNDLPHLRSLPEACHERAWSPEGGKQ